jgi:predicted MFS family arabinose efflux permease
VSLVYGFTKASSDGWSAAPTLIFLSIAVVLLACFVLVEARATDPLLPLRVVAERNCGGSFLASFLLGAGLFAMFVFLSFYMQTVLQYSALKAGVAFLPFAIGLIVAATFSSTVVPRIGPRIPMAGGLLIGAVGLGWLTQIGVHTSFWVYVFGPQILMSVGLGFAFPAISNTALSNVGAADSGVASALVNTTQQIGGSLGTALLNTVAATATASYIRASGPSSVPSGLVHGYSVAFAVGAVFLLAASLAAAVLVKDRSVNLPVDSVNPVLAAE